MRFSDQAILTWIIWTACVLAALAALIAGNWSVAFVALMTCLNGYFLCMQSLHAFGVTPFALSNAQDCIVGATD